jgi:hypothetical protein
MLAIAKGMAVSTKDRRVNHSAPAGRHDDAPRVNRQFAA